PEPQRARMDDEQECVTADRSFLPSAACRTATLRLFLARKTAAALFADAMDGVSNDRRISTSTEEEPLRATAWHMRRSVGPVDDQVFGTVAHRGGWSGTTEALRPTVGRPALLRRMA